jgi:hypothetical protein
VAHLRQVREARRAYDEWGSVPFPLAPDADDGALSNAFFELVDYDGFIAGLVSRLASGSRVPAKWRDGLRFDDGLKERLEELAARPDPAEAQLARTYLDYLARLGGLIDVALEAEHALAAAGQPPPAPPDEDS